MCPDFTIYSAHAMSKLTFESKRDMLSINSLPLLKLLSKKMSHIYFTQCWLIWKCDRSTLAKFLKAPVI